MQAIQVTWSHDNTTYRDDIVFLVADFDEGIRGRYATEYADAVDLPAVTASPAFHDRLTADFETVTYIAQVCTEADDADSDGPWCSGVNTVSRADFDAVSLGDRATVTVADDRIEVRDVERGTRRDWEYDVHEYSWADEHDSWADEHEDADR